MGYAPINLGTNSTPSEDGHAGACRHINCTVEMMSVEGKVQAVLAAVDGYVNFATLAEGGAIRAMLAVSSDLYVVAGRLLFRVDATGAATQLGGIPSDGLVTMARNRLRPDAQIAIVCDGLYFILQGGVLTQQADPDLPPPVSVCDFSGYFVHLQQDGRFFASELDDADVTALSFATADRAPDKGVRCWVRGADLMIGGETTIEAWADVGGDPFPFARTTVVQTAEDQKSIGVLAGGSVAENIFVGHDGTVRKLAGYQAGIISTPEIHRLIAEDTNPHGLTATSWQSRGRNFYALSGSGWTRVYDGRAWHERESYAVGRWRIAHAVQYGDRIILGDYATNKLYEMRHDAADEAGAHLVMAVQAPPVHAWPYKLKHAALYVDVVPGVGTLATTDPQIMIDYSDDGGQAFGVQRMRDLGADGQRLKRVKVTGLGSSASRTYRFSMSAAVRRCILAAGLDVDKMRA